MVAQGKCFSTCSGNSSISSSILSICCASSYSLKIFSLSILTTLILNTLHLTSHRWVRYHDALYVFEHQTLYPCDPWPCSLTIASPVVGTRIRRILTTSSVFPCKARRFFIGSRLAIIFNRSSLADLNIIMGTMWNCLQRDNTNKIGLQKGKD